MVGGSDDVCKSVYDAKIFENIITHTNSLSLSLSLSLRSRSREREGAPAKEKKKERPGGPIMSSSFRTPPLSPTMPTTTTHFDPLDPIFPDRVIAHFDLDCFYCQVERSLDASLKEQPTGVCQYDPFERDGVTTRGYLTDRKTHLMRSGANNSLIAVSYEARKRGVKRNMKIGEARRCCPVRFVWFDV